MSLGHDSADSRLSEIVNFDIDSISLTDITLLFDVEITKNGLIVQYDGPVIVEPGEEESEPSSAEPSPPPPPFYRSIVKPDSPACEYRYRCCIP